MTYRIEFRPSPQGDGQARGRRLPPSYAEGRRAGVNPHPTGCRKLAGHPNLYRVRAGDWRIVYEVDDALRLVTITLVAHRREVYRGL